jgi:membrane associated rhomboid family serine protease
MLYRTSAFGFGGGDVTPVVKALLIANVAVFVLQLLLPTSVIVFFGLVPALVWQEFYIWQLFTYQFFHGGLLHLLFNMLALWMFGCDLERRWGSEFFTKYYMVSVIGGAILNVVLAPSQMVPSIGASAGIYGILLAYGVLYPDQIIYFYFLFPMKMKYFVMIIGAIALYSSAASGPSGIAHLAHVGGMLFGYLYLRAAGGSSRQWRGYNPWQQWKLYQDRRRLERLKRRFKIYTGGKDDDPGPTFH